MTSTPRSPLVLVADDSAVARLSLVRRLHAEGLNVLERESSRAARVVDATLLACALLDLDLGDGNGLDVATALRAKRPDLPVAFFSGGAHEDLEARARQVGPLFAKPEGLDDAVLWVVAHAR